MQISNIHFIQVKLNMPTYDYACHDCGQTFEVKQSIKDDRLSHCICEEKSANIERLISKNPGGFILKGSGFYNTDYKSAGQPATKSESIEASSCNSCGVNIAAGESCAAKVSST